MLKLSSTVRRLVVILTIGAFVGLAVSLLNPINSTLYRLLFLGALLGVWFGPIVLLWNRKWCRVTLFIVAACCVIPFLLPSKPIDQDELRVSYVQKMVELEKTTYHWGGENSRGIDCSGLPRRALRNALFSYGVKHADGGAFRMIVEQWWFDTSAEALGQGYRDFTVSLDQEGKIAEMPYTALQQGDIAVTASGIHVIVYIGDDQWIQADPGIGSVATLNGRNTDNAWFKVPVTLHRWSVLVRE